MNLTYLEVVCGTVVAVVAGWVIGDSVREYRDKKTMDRFHTELEVVSGFPAHWRMKS